MATIIDATRNRVMADEILGRYSAEAGRTVILNPESHVYLAVDGGRAVGFISFRGERIGILYVEDGADEQVRGDLVRAAMAKVSNEGRPSLSIHALDINGMSQRMCRALGFEEDGMCTCCQRDGMVCLRKRF